MKVSFNELQGSGRKAFIGIGFAEGDALTRLKWSPGWAHGLGGVAAAEKGSGFFG